MQKSFKEYHKTNNPGNYVSVDVTGLPTALVAGLPGVVTPSPHITLMYSKESAVPLEHVNFILRRRSNIIGTQVKVTGVDVFDDPPKDDTRDTNKGCIVLTLDDPMLHAINEQLTSYGMKHSYTPYSPHVTLMYDLDIGQCHEAVPAIKSAIEASDVFLTLTKFNNEWVKSDWAKK